MAQTINNLDSILSSIWMSAHNSGEAIPKIKQCFTDAGWAQMAYNPVKQEVNSKPIKDILVTNMTAEELLRKIEQGEIVTINGKVICTGAMWYERFEKELYKPPKQELPVNRGDDGESHDRFFRAGGETFMHDRALEAAKKASGL